MLSKLSFTQIHRLNNRYMILIIHSHHLLNIEIFVKLKKCFALYFFPSEKTVVRARMKNIREIKAVASLLSCTLKLVCWSGTRTTSWCQSSGLNFTQLKSLHNSKKFYIDRCKGYTWRKGPRCSLQCFSVYCILYRPGYKIFRLTKAYDCSYCVFVPSQLFEFYTV